MRSSGRGGGPALRGVNDYERGRRRHAGLSLLDELVGDGVGGVPDVGDPHAGLDGIGVGELGVVDDVKGTHHVNDAFCRDRADEIFRRAHPGFLHEGDDGGVINVGVRVLVGPP